MFSGAVAAETKQLNLSLPKDFYDDMHLPREQKVLIIRWKDPMEDKVAREYGKGVLDRLESILQESKRLLDHNGEQVCSNAMFEMLLVIKSNGELESFDIRRSDGKPTSADTQIMNEWERAVLSHRHEFDSFNSDYFAGNKRVGVNAVKGVFCDRTRKYIPLPSPIPAKRR